MKKYEELAADIKNAYENSIEPAEAERLAAKFLHAQLTVSHELAVADLDARMRKTGVKAVKAAVYMEAATAGEKKPSDVMLEAKVNLDKVVQDEQDKFDTAEVERDQLQNYFNIFREAHIYFRGIAKTNLG